MFMQFISFLNRSVLYYVVLFWIFEHSSLVLRSLELCPIGHSSIIYGNRFTPHYMELITQIGVQKLGVNCTAALRAVTSSHVTLHKFYHSNKYFVKHNPKALYFTIDPQNDYNPVSDKSIVCSGNYNLATNASRWIKLFRTSAYKTRSPINVTSVYLSTMPKERVHFT